MAMGIVSDKEFDSEKKRVVTPPSSTQREESNSIPAEIVIEDNPKGRGVGNIGVPDSLRKLIGTTAIEDGRQDALQLASSFGISGSSVGAYTHGSTSTATYNDRPNAPVIGKTKARIAKKSRMMIMKAMRHITEEKLANAKPRDLAGIAKDMSTVMKQMEEVDSPLDNKKNGPTFVLYSPQARDEKVFDVIHAKE